MKLTDLLNASGLSWSEERAGLVVALPELHLAIHPGLQELRPFTPRRPGQPFFVRVPPPSYATFQERGLVIGCFRRRISCSR